MFTLDWLSNFTLRRRSYTGWGDGGIVCDDLLQKQRFLARLQQKDTVRNPANIIITQLGFLLEGYKFLLKLFQNSLCRDVNERRRKRRKSFNHWSVLISKENISISKSTEISRSAEKSHSWYICNDSYTTFINYDLIYKIIRLTISQNSLIILKVYCNSCIHTSLDPN